MSAQNCGCDSEADHQCQAHRDGWAYPNEPLLWLNTMGDAARAETRPMTRATTLPTESAARKTYPLASGLFDYFPDALVAIAHVSWRGSQQHHPDQPLHWDRAKSTDESDTLLRHFAERGKLDIDGLRHSAKMAWRALAILQKEIEQEGA